MKTQHYFIDLTQRPPRSFRVRLGNYVVLARMLDKGRATLAKKNGEYHYDCATDQRLVQFLGFDPDALLKELATGKGDGENARMGSVPFQDPALSLGDRGLVCFHGKRRAGQRRRNTCVLCRKPGPAFQKPGKTSKPGSNSANSMTMSALEEKRKFNIKEQRKTKRDKAYE